MHLYPYHSPVRFYPTKEALLDENNSQNLQFFGSKNSYPLELNEFHRFLIPSYENDIDTTDLELWVIGKNQTEIPCKFAFNEDSTRLMRVTFKSSEEIEGCLEIRKVTGETVFYSNCVRFIKSRLYDGRKFVRVATKCYFNRLGYDFEESQFDWFVTNLPAYDYGLYMIESDYSTIRTGSQNSPKIKDSYLDEISTLSFIGEGDCNVMNFILFSVLNNEFYINGTKRTIKEKPEIDDLLVVGKFKFSYDKDKRGMYLTINEDDIFNDSFKKVLSNGDQTAIYTLSENTAIEVNN
ncbi:hypothetical protein [Chryseobacterium sp.]|uniref:hypothetical protein n=1 Tax=Chryseobacterium sp. TaxID=1871047 RepID=UPI002898B5D5|nr:hypothetical protein [Chryseobacterium sp.]